MAKSLCEDLKKMSIGIRMYEKYRKKRKFILCIGGILAIVGVVCYFYTTIDKRKVEGETVCVNGQVAFFDVNKGFYLVPLSQDDFATDV